MLRRNFSIIYMHLIFTNKETSVWRGCGLLTKARREAFTWVSDHPVDSRGLLHIRPPTVRDHTPCGPRRRHLQAVSGDLKPVGKKLLLSLTPAARCLSQPASLSACLVSSSAHVSASTHCQLLFRKSWNSFLRLKKYVCIDIYWFSICRNTWL